VVIVGSSRAPSSRALVVVVVVVVAEVGSSRSAPGWYIIIVYKCDSYRIIQEEYSKKARDCVSKKLLKGPLGTLIDYSYATISIDLFKTTSVKRRICEKF